MDLKSIVNKNKGKVSTRVYWNFNKDFSNDALKKNAFEIKRAYFGYEYKISEKISSKVTFDVGKNNSGVITLLSKNSSTGLES